MKCPKCGYLGFETVDRCRNCGYDFSLTPDKPDAELTLRESKEAATPLSDLEIAAAPASTDVPFGEPASGAGKSSLDLDRLIGVSEDAQLQRSESIINRPLERTLDGPRTLPSFEEGTPLLDAVERASEGGSRTVTPNLPLFGGEPSERAERRADMQEESAFVAPPRPAGPPLAVRRATPEVTRPKNRAPRPARPDEPPLKFPVDVSIASRSGGGPFGAATDVVVPSVEAASSVARLAAAIIDVILLVGICGAVFYLTMRLADLPLEQYRVLPIVPMSAFLILIVLGYLIAFTAAGGQTIGKMATRIRVVGEEGGPVDVSGAVLRVTGTAVNIATLGIAWLPALFSEDGRSLADRIAHTRVVRA